ncbi:condensation domain-containing protein [Kitasatospora sp. NPDC008115]|uniref:condensation domain-containing protein n=1 Tax=Kitasatospora sp. NPDC008115 TaxID=3364022 RepID=UPI0036E82467
MRQIPWETADIAPGRVVQWRIGPTGLTGPPHREERNRRSASFNQDKHHALIDESRNTDEPLASWLAVTFEIGGTLNRAALESALLYLVRRHDLLRCEFHRVPENLSYAVHRPDGIGIEAVDLGGFDTSQEIRAFLGDGFRKSIDTMAWPPYVMGAVLRDGGSTTVYLAFDHIVSDGMSMPNVVRDVQVAYAAYCRGEDPGLPRPGSYLEFAREQRRCYDSIGVDDDRLVYWKAFIGRNGGVFPRFPLDLGVEPGRLYPPVNDTATLLDDRQAEALEARCRDVGGKPFMGVLAAAAVALRDEGGPDLYRALMPLSERGRATWRDSLGWFVNTLPIEFSAARDLAFGQLIRGVRDGFTTMMESIDVPFIRAWELFAPEHFTGRCWPFPVNFLSYIDMRRCPGAEHHQQWRPTAYVWVSRVNGSASWFQRDSAGLHINSIYVDTPQAHRTMAALQGRLRETLRAMAGPVALVSPRPMPAVLLQA